MLWQEWWVWAVAGVVLGIIEVILPGYIFLGFALGAAVVSLLIGFGISTTSLAPLLFIFAVASLIAWFGLRKVFGIHQTDAKIWERDVNDNP